MPSLKILDASGVSLDMNLVQRIKNHLYYYKKIKVLDLSYCNLNDEMCNDLAVGIMKAKGLAKLYIAGNNMVKGLSSILYNLAFQPAIKFIDISNNQKCDKKETSTSLHKLVRMSQTVETIIDNNIPGLNNALTNDFYYAIGDNNNLSYLDLSYNGNLSNIVKLGTAIAFNALKNGSLSYLDISGCIDGHYNFNNFIKSMGISEDEHNEWYGFQFNSNISKDSPEYYNKIFHCNLQTLVLKDSKVEDADNINYENYMKIILNKSHNLDTLILDNCNHNKYFIDSIQKQLNLKIIYYISLFQIAE